MKKLCAVAMVCLSTLTGWGAGYKISDLQSTNSAGGPAVFLELDQGGVKSWKITVDDLSRAMGTNQTIFLLIVQSNYVVNQYVTQQFVTNQYVTQQFVTNQYVTQNSYISTNYVTNLYVTQVEQVNNSYITNLYVTTNYTTNLYVTENAYISTNYVTNLYVTIQYVTNQYVTTNYTFESFTTNLTVQNIATVKTLIVTNVTVINSLDVPTDGHFGTITVTNNSYFYGPALSYSLSASNAPAENELPTAHWVRSLFNNGLILYNTTNVYTPATNTDEARPLNAFTNTIPQPARKHYPAVNLNDYIGSVIATNRFQFLQGPVLVHAFLEMTNGVGSPSVSVHPELYYSYDGTNWLGDWIGQNLALTTGTNLYEWVISFPSITSTNSTGFLIQRRFKVGAVGGATHPGVVVHIGTNYLSGTNDAGHISIQGVNSASVAAAVNFNEMLSVSNCWDGTVTNAVVDFGARKVVWNLTNGITFTNFAGLEAGLGTRALVLEMWLQGYSNTPPTVAFPTLGGSQYSVRIFTNDYSPIFLFVTNATRQWLLWEAHGTNITLDNRVYF